MSDSEDYDSNSENKIKSKQNKKVSTSITNIISDAIVDENITFELTSFSLTPPPVIHDILSYIGHLSMKGAKRISNTFDFILENVVIEYHVDIGREKCYFDKATSKNYTYTYMKTYASVGIPSRVYNWILNGAISADEVGCVICKSKSKCDQYTWVTAKLPLDKSIDCIAYSNDSKERITLRSLFDVIKILKSNAIGYGKFRILVGENNDGDYEMIFVLKEFQIVDKTNISSTNVSPIIEIPTSNELLQMFQK